MATKKYVSKKDIKSVRSILRKHFDRMFDGSVDYLTLTYSSYNGKYKLISGEIDYMSLVFQNDIGDYYVRFIKRFGYNHIRDYKIVSIQFIAFGDETPLVNILPRFLGDGDPDVKDLLRTYIELCPDSYSFQKYYNIKYGIVRCEPHNFEAETEEAETEEAETEEAETEDAETEEAETEEAIDIEEVITTNKYTDYNAYRKEKLLSVDFDTLDKLYCLARSFINGRLYNFNYYITDMKLSCCEREEVGGIPIIRDYIACRINVKSNKALFVDEEICCYIVIKDERYAETLIYI